MDALTKLLATVLFWGLRRGLTPEQITTAQSLAWYYRANYKGPPLPKSHWAKQAVRAVLNGRDLPGCGTGQSDALNHMLQGAGMGQVMDREPPPDTLASHRELLERILSELSEIKRQVVVLRLAEVPNLEIAAALDLSPGRVSQIAREIVERWHRG